MRYTMSDALALIAGGIENMTRDEQVAAAMTLRDVTNKRIKRVLGGHLSTVIGPNQEQRIQARTTRTKDRIDRVIQGRPLRLLPPGELKKLLAEYNAYLTSTVPATRTEARSRQAQEAKQLSAIEAVLDSHGIAAADVDKRKLGKVFRWIERTGAIDEYDSEQQKQLAARLVILADNLGKTIDQVLNEISDPVQFLRDNLATLVSTSNNGNPYVPAPLTEADKDDGWHYVTEDQFGEEEDDPYGTLY